MIFVTVGTHEQPFNRLVKAVDDLKKNGVIIDEVIIRQVLAPINQNIANVANYFRISR